MPSDGGFLDPTGKCGGWIGHSLGQLMYNPLQSLQRGERLRHRSHTWAPKTKQYFGNVNKMLSWGGQSVDLHLPLEASLDGILGMGAAMISTTEGTVGLGREPPGPKPDPLYLV